MDLYGKCAIYEEIGKAMYAKRLLDREEEILSMPEGDPEFDAQYDQLEEDYAAFFAPYIASGKITAEEAKELRDFFMFEDGGLLDSALEYNGLLKCALK